MEEKCKLCRFWEYWLTQEFSDKPDIDIGHCRRYPKAFKVQTETRCLGLGMTPRSCVASVLEYPEHREGDWCGEFKPKDVEEYPADANIIRDDKHILDVVTKAAQSDGRYRRAHRLQSERKDNGKTGT